MAKKKPTKAKMYKHKEPRESFHLPAGLKSALQDFVNRTEPRPSKSAVIKMALEKLLAERGFWPRSDDAD